MAFTAAALGEILHALACGSPMVRTAEQRWPRPNTLLLGTVGGTAALQVAMFFFPLTRRLLGITPLDRRDWMTVLAGAGLPALLAVRRRHLPEPVTGSLSPGRSPALPPAARPEGGTDGFRVA